MIQNCVQKLLDIVRLSANITVEEYYVSRSQNYFGFPDNPNFGLLEKPWEVIL